MIKLNSKIKFKRGFTLIELLVVISIIALLSSVVLSSLNKAQTKARDSQRIQALQQINKALELYYDDNGNYPIFISWVSSKKPAFGPSKWNSPTGLSYYLKKYIKELPIDPINSRRNVWGGGVGYGYFYISNKVGSKYDLVTFFESNSNPLACSQNNWYSNVGILNIPSSYFAPNYWCTSIGNVAYTSISNRNNLYDIAPRIK